MIILLNERKDTAGLVRCEIEEYGYATRGLAEDTEEKTADNVTTSDNNNETRCSILRAFMYP